MILEAENLGKSHWKDKVQVDRKGLIWIFLKK